ncbi:glycosyltransferase family 39 protein [Nguyenibacter vanlangensis]|uniref:Glycosyltransferase family 39 protein n=1 Tax=Nguyenibacter vanlangensis TaxID=1216886 RepID=A0ABZ3D506_9PROT
MSNSVFRPELERFTVLFPFLVAFVHLFGNPHYGFFRDELYFIVCGRHPDYGYVDQPFVVPFLAAGSQAFGTSLFTLRAIPAACAAITVWATMVLARDMGARFWGVCLTGTTTALAPVLVAFGTVLGPDAVGTPAWTLAVLAVARALQGRAAFWIPAGVALGFAMETKDSALFLVLCLAGGVLLTGRWRDLLSFQFVIGAILAVAITLPNAVWQALHHWPMLELLKNGRERKNIILSPTQFVFQLASQASLIATIFLICGLVWSLCVNRWRWLGVTYLLLLLVMIVLHGKAYYLAPIDPCMLAAGGAAWSRCGAERRLTSVPMLTALVMTGCALLPLTMPILSERSVLAYRDWLKAHGLHFRPTEYGRTAPIGANFADMHGWRLLAYDVMRLRPKTAAGVPADIPIFASDYGLASAIEVFEPASDRSRVISGHNNYWIWGPGAPSHTVIDVGGTLVSHGLCGEARTLGTFHSIWALPVYQGLPILECLDLREPISESWLKLKHYW